MEELNNKIEELNTVNKEIIKLENKLLNKDLKKLHDKLITRRFFLRQEIELCSFALNNEPVISNGIIDLYLYKDNKGISDYKIFLTGTSTHIGEIKYNINLGKDIFKGNISYFILPKYRGNHYALDSLNLITDLIYEKGINEIYIAAFNSNIPSIKTIKNFGGVLFDSNNDISSYICDLKKIKKNKTR